MLAPTIPDFPSGPSLEISCDAAEDTERGSHCMTDPDTYAMLDNSLMINDPCLPNNMDTKPDTRCRGDTDTYAMLDNSIMINDTYPPSTLVGGGPISTQRSFPRDTLISHDKSHCGDESLSTSELYDFVAYVDHPRLDSFIDSNSLLFAIRLPLSMLAPRLLVQELIDLSRLHGIVIDTRMSKASLINLFNAHDCDGCNTYWSVFSPHGIDHRIHYIPFREEDFSRVKASVKPFTDQEMAPWLTSADARIAELYSAGAIVHRIVEGSFDVATNDSELISSRVPWLRIAEKGSKNVVLLVARTHGLQVQPRLPRQSIINALKLHRCTSCPSFTVVFRPLVTLTSRRVKAKAVEPFVLASVDEGMKESIPFPPKPPSVRDIADFASDFCDALRPSEFEEAGCMVCGQLVLRTELTPWNDLKESIDLDCLKEKGVARKERKSIADPILFEQGPVVDWSLNKVCQMCVSALRKTRRPTLALANGFWLGEVPSELKDLTFVEQLLVARIRHNRCVVRVSSGQTKMVANVVSFANPTAKVYKKLPPSKADLDEVLAFIFTGVKPPSDEDLQRTPMLVRRNRVYDALHWLRLNHSDYRDLDIDQDALMTYDEMGVPVKVMFRSNQSATNLNPSATSVHETEEEIGVDGGRCPFQVHGLTGEELCKLTLDSRKMRAVNHLKNGGHVLAIGHADNPESMYDNPQLYPQMFPWLFPYGLGGIGVQHHLGLISEINHKRALLMYHDKRFQLDSHFVIVAFNHHQLKASYKSSFLLTKRSNFTQICRELRDINPAVLASVSKRLENGPRFTPTTEAEKRCFSLLDKIDVVNTRVPGSISSRKYMRKELWSLIYSKGAPTWFLTIAPVDIKHPLCIYFADTKQQFSPEIRGQNERFRLIAQNPVAGARFFDFMVKLLIKIILRWDDNDSRAGVYGNTSAFYGTVEQQGRMTLHLHMLIWIASTPSPQEMRDRLLAGDEEFKRAILAYLEAGQFGDFYSGTHEELTALKDSKRAFVEDEDLRLPEAPPVSDEACQCASVSVAERDCKSCDAISTWYRNSFQRRVDDILLKSNTHKCYLKRTVISADGSKKEHLTGKGCINKEGVCTARFPRDVFPESSVDEDGHINVMKHEPLINTVVPLISWAFGCNTDSASLNSGTAVSATVGYVAEYLTKMGLKTYQIFSSAYDVFEKNTDLVEDLHTPENRDRSARRLIMKMVNTLTSKMEIGGPMAAMYLLGNPDRYSSHNFVAFYWKSFVDHVLNDWEEMESRLVDGDGHAREVPQVNTSYSEETVMEDEFPDENEDSTSRVVVGKTGSQFVPRSAVDDYRFRPSELEQVSLYDWVQCAVRESLPTSESSRKVLLRYREDHPNYKSHGIKFDVERRNTVVPNFIGPMIPRQDSEDREYYCTVMMTLFCPWRSASDLRSSAHSWSATFQARDFPERHKAVMKNMQVRYECYDARDDYHAQLRSRINKLKQADGVEEADEYDEDLEFIDELADSDVLLTDLATDDPDSDLGIWTQRKLGQMKDLSLLLQTAGWQINVSEEAGPSIHAFRPEQNLSSSKWRELLATERKKILRARQMMAPSTQHVTDDMDIESAESELVRILPPKYFLRDFSPNTVELRDLMTDIIRRFGLNEEQERAFRIVANHSTCAMGAVDALRMYIGGMGGTGKTQVIKSLLAWFSDRTESHRMIVLAPTGSAASLVNGSTYHSYLCIRTGERRTAGEGPSAAIDEARGRMLGVNYIFLDEISMVSCHDLFLIDARLKSISGIDDTPFGGYNIIVAGDFAQLPPAKGLSLYSGEVSKVQNPRDSVSNQENTLGLLAWHQFVTVVILKKNMRQTSQSGEDAKFRTMLSNMRFKSCTDDDVAFLRSRIPSFNSNLSLNDECWRNVSVITAWNTYKDQINEMNAARFAHEKKRTLYHFYSIDKSSRTPNTRGRPAKSSRPVPLTPSVQKVLWKSPPYTSEHVAGCLPICLDMPVMIRHNEATELCITKGQEAKVVGWTSYEIPSFPGHIALDTLFLELINPPKDIKLPHLPMNVVPLTKNTQSIRAVLPNDKVISISRQQVPVLLNFSMTDYASQGKTRPVNVVDLSKCRNHQAIYTALSRGTSASNTIIVQDFNWNKIKGGLSGFLRQEFRDLDILDEMTKLLHEGNLPTEIVTHMRDSTIKNFQRWKAGLDISVPVPAKRKSRTDEDDAIQSPSKKPRLHEELRVTNFKRMSLKWDSINHSCAYDSLFSILKAIWDEKPRRWGGLFRQYSGFLRKLASFLPRVDKKVMPFEKARDLVRKSLHRQDKVAFPHGKTGTDLLNLIRITMGMSNVDPVSSFTCSSCEARIESQVYHRLDKFVTMYATSGSTGAYLRDLLLESQPCDCGGELTLDHVLCPLFAMNIPKDVSLSVKVTLIGEPYRLAGIIYEGGNHFTARVVTPEGVIFTCDSMVEGDTFRLEGVLESESPSLLQLSGPRRAAVALYCRTNP